ncbi:hypothetical protein LCGC14_2014600 [marine sediment metagenome]|uniref:Uncharacterized protein n=1 Tax=marine sediment metagenome TaxID=412755 RepID=A0A0F9HWJ0_9ZZZZ
MEIIDGVEQGSGAVAAITSGTIDGAIIGGSTAAAGTFTTLSADSIADLDSIALFDSNDSHSLTITWDENDTSNRTLKFKVSTGSRVLTMTGDATIADWFDQSVKTTASPAFTSVGAVGDTDLLSFAADALTVNGTISSGAITCTALDAGSGTIETTGKGRFVGSDFMTDGGFDDDGAWSIGDNWSVTGSQGVYSGGAVAPTYLQPDPALTIISGRDYVASINIVSWSGTLSPLMLVGGDQNTLSTDTGVQYSYFTTVNTTNARLRAADQELTVDDFTLRLLPENPSEVGDLIVWRDLTVAGTIAWLSSM